MRRRDFIRNSVFGLIAVSVSSYVEPDEGDCDTTNDILGPFYRPGAPEKSDLSYTGQKAEKLMLQGRVYTNNCITSIKNAKVEIWHADAAGEYDNDSDAFLNRGIQKSDDKGDYKFTAAIPGRYLNGDQYRPSHIHFRVTAEGHKDLISQIYFKEDPFISIDPWASQPKAGKRILPVTETEDKLKQVNFDIYLVKK